MKNWMLSAFMVMGLCMAAARGDEIHVPRDDSTLRAGSEASGDGDRFRSEECTVVICQFAVKYKARIQGLQARAEVCDLNGDPVGSGWRICFVLTLNGIPVDEVCKATRRSGGAKVRFADLDCGRIYEACVLSVENPEGEPCTPPEPPCQRRIIGCLRP